MKHDSAVTVEAAQLEMLESPWVVLTLVFSSVDFADRFYSQIATPDLQRQNRDKSDLGSVLRSPYLKAPVSPVFFSFGSDLRDEKIIGYVSLMMSDSTFVSFCCDGDPERFSFEQIQSISPGFLKTVQALLALAYAIDPEMGCKFEMDLPVLREPTWWKVYGRFVTHRGMQAIMPGLVAESEIAASQPIAEFIKGFGEMSG